MNRAPYYIIAGIDFGTAFTKCMVRNTATNELKAVTYNLRGKTKYLLPSLLHLEKKGIVHPLHSEAKPGGMTIPYLKMALVAKCRGEANHWQRILNQANGRELPYDIPPIVEGLVGFYLLCLIGRIVEFVRENWPDFGSNPDDQIFYNMSLPADDMQQEAVLGSFKKCLYWAVSSYDRDDLPDYDALTQEILNHPKRDGCNFLGEVTANVMSYRKERGGRPGLYLFVDVGAGTVDLSVFLYPDERYFTPMQTYTAAVVSMTGSSQIELRAFERFLGDKDSPEVLWKIRQCKEGNSDYRMFTPLIEKAKTSLRADLDASLRATLGVARTNHVPNEFKTMNVLMGGGGWCDIPYKTEVESVTADFHLRPELLPLPKPQNSGDIWPGLPDAPKRFSVALGLSYPPWEWPDEIYPDDLNPLPRTPPRPRPINPASESDG